MADGYARLRQIHQDISSTATVDPLDTELSLVTPKVSHSVYVQRVIVDITDPVDGLTWSIMDSEGETIIPAFLVGTDDLTHREFDLGAKGRPCSDSASLVLVADAGASGLVTWCGYAKLGVGYV